MAFHAKGLSGEIRVGGRKAATLGRWELKSQGNLSFICEAQVVERDDYLMSSPHPRELRLDSGKRQWVWKAVQVGGGGDTYTISGSGKMALR